MENKTVSIILIHYNQKEFIKEALKSVFNQVYKKIELIIADDASEKFDLRDIKNMLKRKIKIDTQ